MQFEKFPKIEKLNKLNIQVTQKIHGTNAHILVLPPDENANPDAVVEVDGQKWQVQAASRNRFIYPEDDNYGFANFVRENQQEIAEKLGPGRHDGEWCGLGVNSGEGLDKKMFLLFDFWKFPEKRPLPPQVGVVPVLYNGPLHETVIEEIMADLKENGSKLTPGFMRPEGIVVKIAGKRFKKVFTPEETKWTQGKNKGLNKGANKRPQVDYSHLCQPIRLEKLLSMDERLKVGYPETLPEIVKQYVGDLIDEGQIVGDEDQVKAIKKGATGQIFKFIKEFAVEKGM